MALNYRGAEAVVTACEWHGQPAIEKHRNLRNYRHPDLEVRLVTERLRAEARLLERASEAGLPVPPLYAVDPAAATLVMAWLPGEPLERALRAPNGVAWLPQLGELLALSLDPVLHGAVRRKRMHPSSLAIALDQYLVRAIQEDSRHLRARSAQLLHHLGKTPQKL